MTWECTHNGCNAIRAGLGEEIVPMGTMARIAALEADLAKVTAQRNEYYEMYWDNRCTCGMSRAQRETSPGPDGNYTDSIDVPPPCGTVETKGERRNMPPWPTMGTTQTVFVDAGRLEPCTQTNDEETFDE